MLPRPSPPLTVGGACSRAASPGGCPTGGSTRLRASHTHALTSLHEPAIKARSSAVNICEMPSTQFYFSRHSATRAVRLVLFSAYNRAR